MNDNKNEGNIGGLFFNPFVTSVFSVSSIFCLLTFVISFHLMLNHFKFYSKPDHQRYIIRIIFMIPLYSVLTLCTVLTTNYKIYLELVRDLYEAYVIYVFFALLTCYAGGDENLINHFVLHEPISVFEIKLPYLSDLKYKPNQNFLYYCRLSVFQYIIVKPLLTLMAIVLLQFNLYGSSFSQFNKFYPYKIIIQFVSVGLALSAILFFLKMTFSLLLPYKPILKFLSIKIVLGFCFWQSIVFMLINKLDFIPDLNDVKASELLDLVNIALTTFELFIVSIVHVYAYPYDFYRVIAINSQPLLVEKVEIGSFFNNIFHTINQNDMLEETMKSIKGSSKNNFNIINGNYQGLVLDDGDGDFDDTNSSFTAEKIEMGEFLSHNHPQSPLQISQEREGKKKQNQKPLEKCEKIEINEIKDEKNDNDNNRCIEMDGADDLTTSTITEKNRINERNNNCEIEVTNDIISGSGSGSVGSSSDININNSAILVNQFIQKQLDEEYISDDLFLNLISSHNDDNDCEEVIIDDHDDISRSIKR
ncbi:hypothetical protein RB653_009011 [Dictyostelium firmibasis]|uniref:Uncharacterized protein n=1 Tax=Dictyostelium firmibasis TaxID=79012 RepID=A0AAN7TTL4_9MYCE